MEQQMASQIIVNGLVAGSIYTIAALGLTLIFSIGRVFNFAHGEFYMLGAFATYFAVEQFHLPYVLAVLSAIIIVGILGILVEFVFFRPLRGQFHAPMIISLGLSLILPCGAFLLFGQEDKSVATDFPGIIRFSNITISAERIAVIIGTILLLIALYCFLKYSKAGQALQAVAQDSEAASVQGININHIFSLSFAISGGLAGAAGALIAPLFAINAFIGSHIIFKLAGITIIGGMGSVVGSVLGGFLWGFTESLASTFIGSNAQLIVFGLVVVVLLIKPKGFFGHD